jgi:uroporphyrinogen III methyltransferase / synthase
VDLSANSPTLPGVANGKVYLIGAGPGDPSLLTLRAADVLGRCDVVLYDALAHPSLLDWMKPGAEARFVGKRGGEYSEPQEAINRALVEHATQGKLVGRLKGGDPLLFARGAEEALYLAERGIPFEIIPGVSSPVAASAYAGIPLTHRDLASSVLFLTGTAREGTGPDGHDWQRLATRAGTICVLMGLRRLREIAGALIAYGRDPQALTAVVQSGSRPDQRTITGPLERIADLAIEAGIVGPALVIIGAVVGLRERLRWFDTRPLFGRRVLVTRAKEQAGRLTRCLMEAGADAVAAPTIAIHPPDDPAPLAAAVARLGGYDWVALTSANGVERLFAEIERQGRDARAFGAARVAAIGPGTAAALAARGIRADLVPGEFRGEALAAALLEASGAAPAGRASSEGASSEGAGGRWPRVLLPRARVARDAFPEAVRAAGGEVDVVAAYESRAPGAGDVARLRELLASGKIDVVTLTAASTVENLVAMLGAEAPRLLSGVALASIGPITTAAAERAGLSVAVTAEVYTIEGLVSALERHFAPASPPPASPPPASPPS